ncbi:sigma 54-interacting transcriptional regulator [Clostridium sp. SYSU_GA19001]|uniref:sigma-54 interaction domain-containing protein n=1 Tax=Clostridium caldaquaticum TaxID=2940653 RepID=UPI002076F423|nr:sigma 54-interacting transcriptional regulator [Clostridium caldaquaticum]MCM8711251.1 sigma 54-interacting transcriptional regulator [Clostridium caldaquaticum]
MNNKYIPNPELIEIDEELNTLKDFIPDENVLKIINAYDALINKLKSRLHKLELESASHISLYMMGDILLDGVCLVDLESRVVSINDSYKKLTGLTEEEVIGQKTEDLLKKKLISVSITPKAIKEKRKVTALSSNRTGDKTFLITAHPIFDEEGNIKGALSILRDMTELTNLRRNLEQASEQNERYLRELKKIKTNQINNSSIIGESYSMLKLKDLIQHIATTDATVLITGETGTGKEVVAREIHARSERCNGPYIRVNCAALPENLIESELFGYEKGAFTGALSNGKIGMFELANNGTLLLDEVSEIPLPIQVKLLRVLQEREIMRLGGTKSIKLNVRIIAAANQDFQKLINEGKFRADLYYRLLVVPIKIPPLRERKDDIPILSWYFLDKFNTKYRRNKRFEREALYFLENHYWPGNVRELENVIERLVVITMEDTITSQDVQEILSINSPVNSNTIKTFPAVGSTSLNRAVDSFEKELIADALKKYGSTYKAAKALGISQSTVFRKAQAFGLLNKERA